MAAHLTGTDRCVGSIETAGPSRRLNAHTYTPRLAIQVIHIAGAVANSSYHSTGVLGVIG